MELGGTIERLRREAETALREATDPGALLPILHRLAKSAPDGSEAFAFAHRNLAEILVDRDPWRAALHARRATSASPDDDRGWAAMGLCQTLLGNYRAAASAYHRAVECAPGNPWYAHNLGHLLDVALGRARDAVGWLRRAYEGARCDGEIATSFAQALARAGETDEARRVLKRATKKGATREQAALLKWLNTPAEERAAKEPLRQPRTPAGRVQLRDGSDEVPPSVAGRAVRSNRRKPQNAEARQRALGQVSELLDRGMARLPLDEAQRARAQAMAVEAVTARLPADESQARVLAAAVAYAVIHDESVPLSPTEVASTFRVSVASLRGRFTSLRARLSLERGIVKER
jgi:tetratricopeptide (TPR) repeat protein